MDNRLLTPDFIGNNLTYVKSELAKEGKSIEVKPATFIGEGTTAHVVDK